MKLWVHLLAWLEGLPHPGLTLALSYSRNGSDILCSSATGRKQVHLWAQHIPSCCPNGTLGAIQAPLVSPREAREMQLFRKMPIPLSNVMVHEASVTKPAKQKLQFWHWVNYTKPSTTYNCVLWGFVFYVCEPSEILPRITPWANYDTLKHSAFSSLKSLMALPFPCSEYTMYHTLQPTYHKKVGICRIWCSFCHMFTALLPMVRACSRQKCKSLCVFFSSFALFPIQQMKTIY